MNSDLKIYNTLSGNKEQFTPIHKGHVGMYVCGPTVYNDVHLGNCRTFISFDMICRYLRYAGYRVRYVRNVTDAGHLENDADAGEDKISKKARLESLEPMEIVQRYTVGFHRVMEKFNNVPPDIEPTATGHIIEQIGIAKIIIEKGLAYESNGSVYFDVEKYNAQNQYGILSNRNVEEMMANTRDLDGQEEKRGALDFALWKKASPMHIMRWPSPWSEGFPGWHLECTAMSTKYLGETFDIHGGGMDLKFPHHECEIAQGMASCGSAPVKYWMHANMLTLNGKKMSKSAGNSLLPDELFTGQNELLNKAYHPMVVRFFMMQAHYRSVLDFSSDALGAAEKGFFRLMEALAELESLPLSDKCTADIDALITSFHNAMDDDFNTPILLANIFESVGLINRIKLGSDSITEPEKKKLTTALHGFVFDVMGLQPITSAGNDKLNAVMEVLLDIRKQVRENKDWKTSDLIRDKLDQAGIAIKDSKEGSSWSVK